MIVVVRHGRTESNASGLLLGRMDPPLDDTGRAQAAAAASVLSGVGRVVTSPLLRTRQTAALIAEAAGVEVEVDERFVELDYGDWDGRPVGDVAASEWAAWRSDLHFTPPGGESLATMGERVRAGLDEIEPDAEREDVAIVTHVSPVKAAVAWALGVGDETSWRMFVTPASITRIAVGSGRRSLTAFGEVAHLGG
jgi:broad specificity phosphatase PhoE